MREQAKCGQRLRRGTKRQASDRMRQPPKGNEWETHCDGERGTYELQRGIDRKGSDPRAHMISARKDLRKGERTDKTERGGIEDDDCIGGWIKL